MGGGRYPEGWAPKHGDGTPWDADAFTWGKAQACRPVPAVESASQVAWQTLLQFSTPASGALALYLAGAPANAMAGARVTQLRGGAQVEQFVLIPLQGITLAIQAGTTRVDVANLGAPADPTYVIGAGFAPGLVQSRWAPVRTSTIPATEKLTVTPSEAYSARMQFLIVAGPTANTSSLGAQPTGASVVVPSGSYDFNAPAGNGISVLWTEEVVT